MRTVSGILLSLRPRKLMDKRSGFYTEFWSSNLSEGTIDLEYKF